MTCNKTFVDVLDIFCITAISIVIFAMFAPPAFAYVDPSVMTYTIQALAGVAVALSAVAGVAFRRTRKAIFKLFKIDENANKIVDPKVHRIEGGSDKTSLVSAFEKADKTRVHGKPKSYGVRFVQAFLAIAFFVVTIFVEAPLEIVAGSTDSLLFRLQTIIGPIIIAAIVITLVCSLIVALLRGKAFNVVIAIIFALAIAAYAQSLFLNTGLPPADGSPVHWEDHDRMMLLSSVVWFMILAVCLTLALCRNRFFSILTNILCIALLAVQIIATAALPYSHLTTGRAEDSYNSVATRAGLNEVSSKNNVIVFVLDTFDTNTLKQTLDTYPNALDEMTGFTRYVDSTGSMIPTPYAIPCLLTGAYPEQDQTSEEYFEHRWDHTDFLDTLNDKGYSVGVYSDTLEDKNSVLESRTVNVQSLDSYVEKNGIDPLGAIKILYRCSLYRVSPWPLKQNFWFYTDQINRGTFKRDVRSQTETDPSNTLYILDDLLYYKGLTHQGIEPTDAGENGAFKLIHLSGSHGPYNMTNDAKNAGPDGSNIIDQSAGSLEIVSEYIRQLKALGLYDDATIIITADHGYWYYAQAPLPEPSSPIMLVKQQTSSEQSQAPITISTAPVSHADFIPTVLDAIDADYSAYGTPMKDQKEGESRERSYFMTVGDLSKLQWVALQKCIINGYAEDLKNWTFTDQMWELKN